MSTQFVTDDNGKKIAVVLSIKEYERLITADIPEWQKKELDKRWANYLKNPDSAIDVDQAFEEIEKELL